MMRTGIEPSTTWARTRGIGSDARQALRLRRFAFAGAFSLLYLLVLAIFLAQGALAPDVLVEAAVLVLLAIVTFSLLLVTGLNRRFADASLTEWQLLTAMSVMLYVIYRAPETRLAFNAFFFVALMFGMLRLTIRQLSVLGVAALVCYALVMLLRNIHRPDADALRLDILQCVVMTATLPWFLFVGEHVKRLKRGLSAANVVLEDVKERALRDDLTGAYNRRGLLLLLEEARRSAETSGEPLSLCVVDLDHFKRFNDQVNHLAGDQVLRLFADAARAAMRASDLFGRYGGEEFVQVLPQTALPGALIDAERLRARIAALHLPTLARTGPLTVSIGVAEHVPGESIMNTFARADAALLRAKAAGRNRVEAAAGS